MSSPSCGGSPCSAHPGSSLSRRSSGPLPKRTPDIALELLDDEIMERSAAKAGRALPVAKLDRKAVRVPDLRPDVVAALHGTRTAFLSSFATGRASPAFA